MYLRNEPSILKDIFLHSDVLKNSKNVRENKSYRFIDNLYTDIDKEMNEMDNFVPNIYVSHNNEPKFNSLSLVDSQSINKGKDHEFKYKANKYKEFKIVYECEDNSEARTRKLAALQRLYCVDFDEVWI